MHCLWGHMADTDVFLQHEHLGTNTTGFDNIGEHGKLLHGRNHRGQ